MSLSPIQEIKLQDKLATDAFLKGLKNHKVAYEVMNRDPVSLDEAQKLVEANDHNYKATWDSDANNRCISWADLDCDITDKISPASHRVHGPTYITQEQLLSLMDKVNKLQTKLDLNPATGGSTGTEPLAQAPVPYEDSNHVADQGRRQL